RRQLHHLGNLGPEPRRYSSFRLCHHSNRLERDDKQINLYRSNHHTGSQPFPPDNQSPVLGHESLLKLLQHRPSHPHRIQGHSQLHSNNNAQRSKHARSKREPVQRDGEPTKRDIHRRVLGICHSKRQHSDWTVRGRCYSNLSKRDSHSTALRTSHTPWRNAVLPPLRFPQSSPRTRADANNSHHAIHAPPSLQRQYVPGNNRHDNQHRVRPKPNSSASNARPINIPTTIRSPRTPTARDNLDCQRVTHRISRQLCSADLFHKRNDNCRRGHSSNDNSSSSIVDPWRLSKRLGPVPGLRNMELDAGRSPRDPGYCTILGKLRGCFQSRSYGR